MGGIEVSVPAKDLLPAPEAFPAVEAGFLADAAKGTDLHLKNGKEYFQVPEPDLAGPDPACSLGRRGGTKGGTFGGYTLGCHVDSAEGRVRQALTRSTPRGLFSFHAPRVKSGNFTGTLPPAMERSESSVTADQAAASYTSRSGCSPSSRAWMSR